MYFCYNMKDFKEILWVLLRFLGIWLLLFLLYQWYLNQFSGNIDGFTKIISDQSAFLLNFTGYETVTKDFPSHETILFYINGESATRMIVFAFYKGIKTFYFAFAGIVLLYILNLFRIYVLNVIVVDFPALTKPAHDYFFPAIIYGGVVVLWLIWINKFVITDEKNS